MLMYWTKISLNPFMFLFKKSWELEVRKFWKSFTITRIKCSKPLRIKKDARVLTPSEDVKVSIKIKKKLN